MYLIHILSHLIYTFSLILYILALYTVSFFFLFLFAYLFYPVTSLTVLSPAHRNICYTSSNICYTSSTLSHRHSLSSLICSAFSLAGTHTYKFAFSFFSSFFSSHLFYILSTGAHTYRLRSRHSLFFFFFPLPSVLHFSTGTHTYRMRSRHSLFFPSSHLFYILSLLQEHTHTDCVLSHRNTHTQNAFPTFSFFLLPPICCTFALTGTHAYSLRSQSQEHTHPSYILSLAHRNIR